MLPPYAASELASLAPSPLAPAVDLALLAVGLQGNVGQCGDVALLVEGPTPVVGLIGGPGLGEFPLLHCVVVDRALCSLGGSTPLTNADAPLDFTL